MYGPEYVLPLLLRQRAEQHPDRPFLVDENGVELSYAAAHEQPRRWSEAFRRHGVGAGDLVASMIPNGARSFTVWQGLAWLRATEVPVHDQIRGGMLAHILADCGAELLVADAEHAQRLAEIPDRLARLRTVVICGDGGPPELPCEVVTEAEFLDGAEPATDLDDPRAHDIAAVLYTSGTTGPSKGVLVPWPSLWAAGEGSCPLEDLGPEDVFMHMGTASHVGAKSYPFVMAATGGRIVLRSGFHTSRFWADVDRHGVTTTTLFGAMSHFLMNEPARDDDADHTLNKVLLAPVPPWLPEFNARFGVRSRTTYGMTELPSPIAGTFELDDHRSCGRRRNGFPGCELRIVDEDDYEVPDGQVGELVVRSPLPWTMNLGYLNNPEATVRAWRNGWFHTGDAMWRDDTGRYYFVDRTKDVIRRGGENISSFELESELHAHPGIAEAAAVPVPSATAEDEILAVLAAVPGAELDPREVTEFLALRVARFMVPRYVQFIEALPRTATARVRKAALRASAGERPTWDRVTGVWSSSPWAAGGDRDASG